MASVQKRTGGAAETAVAPPERGGHHSERRTSRRVSASVGAGEARTEGVVTENLGHEGDRGVEHLARGREGRHIDLSDVRSDEHRIGAETSELLLVRVVVVHEDPGLVEEEVRRTADLEVLHHADDAGRSGDGLSRERDDAQNGPVDRLGDERGRGTESTSATGHRDDGNDGARDDERDADEATAAGRGNRELAEALSRTLEVVLTDDLGSKLVLDHVHPANAARGETAGDAGNLRRSELRTLASRGASDEGVLETHQLGEALLRARTTDARVDDLLDPVLDLGQADRRITSKQRHVDCSSGTPAIAGGEETPPKGFPDPEIGSRRDGPERPSGDQRPAHAPSRGANWRCEAG